MEPESSKPRAISPRASSGKRGALPHTAAPLVFTQFTQHNERTGHRGDWTGTRRWAWSNSACSASRAVASADSAVAASSMYITTIW